RPEEASQDRAVCLVECEFAAQYYRADHRRHGCTPDRAYDEPPERRDRRPAVNDRRRWRANVGKRRLPIRRRQGTCDDRNRKQHGPWELPHAPLRTAEIILHGHWSCTMPVRFKG